MKRNISWPQLLTDGGWREQHVKGSYWPRYHRRRRGEMQFIVHREATAKCGACWVLEIGIKEIIRGGLSACLYFAESI